MRDSLFVLFAIVALGVLWNIRDIVLALREIAESLASISADLHALNDNSGSDGP